MSITGRPMIDAAHDQPKQMAVAHYNANAPAMQNLDFFYEWVIAIALRYAPERAQTVCDVGCGTGALLARLYECGYTVLHGADFSPGCLELAQAAVPHAALAQHDIEAAALPDCYDLLFMTTVLDFLEQPGIALEHLQQSLTASGLLFVTVRNRWAYWPWYHLRHVAPLLQRSPRLQHWLLWFSTPLGMRRNDQPCEHVYAPPEARAMLGASGLEIVAETGMMCLPMLWIPGMPRLTAAAQALDRLMRKLPGNNRYYQYMFVCRRAERVAA